MKGKKILHGMIVLTLALTGCDSFSKPTLNGIVKDPSGTPIQGVKVQVESMKQVADTDSTGSYELPYEAGTVTVSFSEPECFHDKKVTIDLTAGEKSYQMPEIVLAPVVSAEALEKCDPAVIARDTGALIEASAKGDVDLIKLFIKAGADVNATGRWKETPLMKAAWKGHPEAVKVLLDAGADVKMSSSGQKGDALYGAAWEGYTDVVKLLIDAGANVNAKTQSQNSALWAASFRGHQDVVEMLLDAGADVNMKFIHDSALSAACRSGASGIALMLLENGADPNLQDKYHTTPIHHAAENGNVVLVKALIAAKADVNIKDNQGKSALDKAEKAGHEKVVALLKAAGAE